MDYTNGSITHEITMSLQFEGILYKGNNKDLSSDLLTEMGLDKAGFYQPSNTAGTSQQSYNGGQSYIPTAASTTNTSNVVGALGGTTQQPVLASTLTNNVGVNPLQGVLGGLPLFAADYSNITNPFPTDARVLNSGIIAPADTVVNSALRFMNGLF
jgi:hypothetical protein